MTACGASDEFKSSSSASVMVTVRCLTKTRMSTSIQRRDLAVCGGGGGGGGVVV